MNNQGAIVLCGGKSTRMGTPKALLPFGEEVMLQRVVRLVGEVVPPKNIVVVAAVGQELPGLPNEVTITHDENPERGPLEGLAAGLRCFDSGRLSDKSQVGSVYATSCDVPLLVPAFVERIFSLLGDHDIAVPKEEAGSKHYHHPLAAVYRTSVLSKVEALLAADRLRPFFLFEECDTREIPVKQLREVDPELRSLMNCNTPEDYEVALSLMTL